MYAKEEFPLDCVICLDEFEDNDRIGTSLFVPAVSILIALKLGFVKNPTVVFVAQPILSISLLL